MIETKIKNTRVNPDSKRRACAIRVDRKNFSFNERTVENIPDLLVDRVGTVFYESIRNCFRIYANRISTR